MHSTHRFVACILAIAAFITLFAGPARAIIGHDTIVAFTDVTGTETRSDALINDNLGPITTSLTASIAGPFGSSFNSVGPLGNLGMRGEFFELGRIDSEILIQNTGIENITGRTQFARANFIIDGGFLQFFAGPGSNFEFLLTITSRVTDGPRNQFTTGIQLVHDANGTQSVLFSGEDIGAAFNPVRGAVEIPQFFGSLDIGLVDPGGIVDLEYHVEIDSRIREFAEIVQFGFSDPLNVDGFGEAPTVTFSDIPNAVPEPAAATLLLMGLGFLATARRFSVRAKRQI